MHEVATTNHPGLILIVAWLAGLAAFVGALLARLAGTPGTLTQQELVHGVVAFGGGILASAVAFALIPKGLETLHPVLLAGVFCSGGVLFCFVDYQLSKGQGSKSQFMAMLLDFVPEAISLGAVLGSDRRLGVLLAAFIGAQNLPEGFNSYREMAMSGRTGRTVLAAFLGVSLLGPIAAWAGFAFLRDYDRATAAIMTFAAGGILYLLFQDLAPQSTMRGRWKPALGAVFGFVAGMIGKQLIG